MSGHKRCDHAVDFKKQHINAHAYEQMNKQAAGLSLAAASDMRTDAQSFGLSADQSLRERAPAKQL